jgi:hypothetical protein
MKTLVTNYRLRDAADKLTEMGFKTSVTDLLGASAAQEFPIHVVLPAGFYIWRKNDKPFAGIPDFFPEGFDFLIVPPSVLLGLQYKNNVELHEAYTVWENHDSNQPRHAVDKYTAVPPYIDESKLYPKITVDDLFIDPITFEYIAKTFLEQSLSNKSGSSIRERKKLESTVFKEGLIEIFKAWPKDKPKPDPVSLVKEAIKRGLADDFEEDDKGKEIKFSSGGTRALKTVRNWLSSDPAFE